MAEEREGQEGAPEATEKRVPLFETVRPPRWVSSILYTYAGIFAPIVVILGSYEQGSENLLAHYQSGTWGTYVALLLTGHGFQPFIPLFLYSILCLALMIWAPAHFANRLWIQLGIVTGVFLSLQYSVIRTIAHINPDSTLALIISVAISVILISALGVAFSYGLVKLGRNLSSMISPLLALSIIPIGFLAILQAVAGIGLLVLLIFLLEATPFFGFSCYLLMCRRISLWSTEPVSRKLVHWILPLIWFGGYIQAWLLAIQGVKADYADLPATPPGTCYIATAAARGHIAVVRSEPVLLPDGQVLWVNRQLRVLKAAELRIAARTPRLHRAMRAVYDTLGPPMARMLASPYLADAAWIALKPFEWLATSLLRVGCRRA